MNKLLLIVSSAVLLFSCKSTRNSKTITTTQQEITDVAKSDSVTVQTVQTKVTELRDVTQNQRIRVKLEFYPPDSSITYTTNSSDPWLNVALQNPRLKSADINSEDSTEDKTIVTADTKTHDSTGVAKADSSHATKEKIVDDVSKTVTTTSFWNLFPWWVWLILIVIAIIIIYIKGKPMFKLLKRVWPFLMAFMFIISCNNPNQEPNGERIGVQSGVPEVHLELTLGQSFYFAFKDGHTIVFILGLICAAGAIFLLVKGSDKMPGKKDPERWMRPVTGLLVLAALILIFSKPVGIRWYEGVWIDKEIFDKAKSDGKLPGLWDDLYQQGRIQGTSKPHK